MTVKLTIDCMGGDHGPSVTVPAAVKFVRAHPDAHLMLVGIESAIRAQLKKLKALDDPALSIVPATEVVAMDDPVEVALRKKKDSSMRVALNHVKDGEAQACISAGNTGALMAVSRYVLKTLPGIERPAIAFSLPNPTGYTMMLDLGANVDCEPQHLLQFAEMGHALVAALEGKDRPTIGLLNIGEEVIKGNETIKRAGELLRASTLNFRGNVEGNDIYKGTVDVIVCDGFVGNVALKTSEGLAQMLDVGRARADAFRHHPRGVRPFAAVEADGAARAARADALQEARRPSAVQRRGAAGAEEPRDQEPRFGRRVRV